MTTGQELWAFAAVGDAGRVKTLLSRPGAQFFINYQFTNGATPLHIASGHGQAAGDVVGG